MSKSVTLRSSDATTGRKKKTPMSASDGARKNHAAVLASDGILSLGILLLRLVIHQPPPLLEDPVNVPVERRHRLLRSLVPADRALAVLEDLRRDLLPLRNLRS